MKKEQYDFPMIAGEPMVCEKHPWRLWQGGHVTPDGVQEDDCAGPGMPLSAGEYLSDKVERLEAALSILRSTPREVHIGSLCYRYEVTISPELHERLQTLLNDVAPSP